MLKAKICYVNLEPRETGMQQPSFQRHSPSEKRLFKVGWTYNIFVDLFYLFLQLWKNIIVSTMIFESVEVKFSESENVRGGFINAIILFILPMFLF